MTVDASGRVHVLVRGEDGKPAHFQRDPKTAKWARSRAPMLGGFIQSGGDSQFVFSDGALHRFSPSHAGRWKKIAAAPESLFENCKPGRDVYRVAHDGWVSTIGQRGKKISVIDFPLRPVK